MGAICRTCSCVGCVIHLFSITEKPITLENEGRCHKE